MLLGLITFTIYYLINFNKRNLYAIFFGLFFFILTISLNVHLRKNIWDTNLSDYELVYAFLSPAIMSKLYLKVKKEMKPGSLFVSNSFAVEGIEASEIWELSDQRKTMLYFYKI